MLNFADLANKVLTGEMTIDEAANACSVALNKLQEEALAEQKAKAEEEARKARQKKLGYAAIDAVYAYLKEVCPEAVPVPVDLTDEDRDKCLAELEDSFNVISLISSLMPIPDPKAEETLEKDHNEEDITPNSIEDAKAEDVKVKQMRIALPTGEILTIGPDTLSEISATIPETRTRVPGDPKPKDNIQEFLRSLGLA